MEIKTIIKGKIIIWNSRDEALLFFIQCSLSSEGSEKARYEKIIKQLREGKNSCSDEE